MADGLAEIFGPRTLRKRQAEEAQPAWAKGSIDRMLAGMDAPAAAAPVVPSGDPQIGLPNSPDQVYDTDPARQAAYLQQRGWRGASDAALGSADLVNMLTNALIKDADYFTGGGLSGGKYDPPQFGMPSQDAADLAAAFSGAEIVSPESMPPDVRHRGENIQTALGLVPTDPTDLAAGAAKLGILHAVPNLFKKAAIEDAARGVDADKIWHDWQWEQNPKGDWWTETTGKPAMNPDVVRPKHVGGALPPQGSDFPADQSAFRTSDQPSLFSEREAPEIPVRNRIQMTQEPYPYNKVESDLRFRNKYPTPAGTVKDYVSNPQLYEQPGLEFLGDLPMQLRDEPLKQGAHGFFQYPTETQPKGRIEVRSDQPHVQDRGIIKVIDKGNADQLETAQHELTHAAAQEFNLPQGYNWEHPDASSRGATIRQTMEGDKQAYEDAFNKRMADYHQAEDDFVAKGGDLKPEDFDENYRVIRPGYRTLTQFKEDWAKANPELQKVLDDNKEIGELLAKKDPKLAYWTSMGEVSARNAARRDIGAQAPYSPLRPEELRRLRPEKTEDVPRKYQWTTDRPSGNTPSASIADDLARAAQPARRNDKQPKKGGT